MNHIEKIKASLLTARTIRKPSTPKARLFKMSALRKSVLPQKPDRVFSNTISAGSTGFPRLVPSIAESAGIKGKFVNILGIGEKRYTFSLAGRLDRIDTDQFSSFAVFMCRIPASSGYSASNSRPSVDVSSGDAIWIGTHRDLQAAFSISPALLHKPLYVHLLATNGEEQKRILQDLGGTGFKDMRMNRDVRSPRPHLFERRYH